MQKHKSLSPWSGAGLTPHISPIYPDHVQNSKRLKNDNSDLSVIDNTNYVLHAPSFKKPPLH